MVMSFLVIFIRQTLGRIHTYGNLLVIVVKGKNSGHSLRADSYDLLMISAYIGS